MCSAITEMPGRTSASLNGRASGRSASASSQRASGIRSRRRCTSSRVSPTMRSSTFTRARAPRSARVRAASVRAAAPVSTASAAAVTPACEIRHRAGHVDRRARVEQRDVARRAGLAGEDPPRRVARCRRACRRPAPRAARERAPRPPGQSRSGAARCRRPRRRALSPTCSSRPDRRRWTLPAPCPPPAAPGRPRSSPGSVGSETPITCRVAPAGLVSGPRKLKIVRTASSRRTGITKRVAPWCIGREHEAEADLVDAAPDGVRRQVDAHAERLQQVGGARQPGGGAVAVLGDRAARARGDQRRRRGDVEGRPPAARARGVDQRVAGRASPARRTSASCAPGRRSRRPSRPSCAAPPARRRSRSRTRCRP